MWAKSPYRAVYEKFKDGTVKDISDDIPFEIPASWEWVRLGTIAQKLTDGTHQTPKYCQSGVPFLSVKDISNGNVSFASCKFISEAEHKLLYSRCDPQNGDILLSKVGTTGIPVLVDTDVQFSLFVSVALLRIFNECVYNKYILNAMLSPFSQMQVEDNTRGVGNKNWVMRDIAHTLIPLPPLTEQKRIVAKVEKLMPLVDEYGKMEEARLQLDADLPATLEKSILQEAIQGKLVPQDPNDEPANELLKRIAAERKVLVKAGKLKASKGESVIFRGSDRLAYETRNGETMCIQDEIPFDIPDSWEWVRLGDLVDTESGLSYKKEDLAIKDQCMIRVLRGGNILDGEFVFKDDDVFIAPKMLSGCPTIHRFDFVLPAVTSHVHLGKTALFRDDLCDTCAGGFLLMLHLLFKDIRLAEYLLLYFQSRTYKDYCKTIANKSGQAFFNLSRKKLLQTPIPIPPMAEQSRIVESMRIIKDQITSLTT